MRDCGAEGQKSKARTGTVTGGHPSSPPSQFQDEGTEGAPDTAQQPAKWHSQRLGSRQAGGWQFEASTLKGSCVWKELLRVTCCFMNTRVRTHSDTVKPELTE